MAKNLFARTLSIAGLLSCITVSHAAEKRPLPSAEDNPAKHICSAERVFSTAASASAAPAF